MRPLAERNCFAVDFRTDISGPAMAHFMPEMSYGVVVRKGLAIRRTLHEQPRVESYVVTVADWRSFCRYFLRFVRSNPHRLRQSQLESSLRTTARQDLMGLLVPWVPDSCDVASYRAVTHRTRFLTIGAEIGVVGQEIEPVAESLDDGTRQILRSWDGKVVEGLVYDFKRAVLVRERRKMNRRRFFCP